MSGRGPEVSGSGPPEAASACDVHGREQCRERKARLRERQAFSRERPAHRMRRGTRRWPQSIESPPARGRARARAARRGRRAPSRARSRQPSRARSRPGPSCLPRCSESPHQARASQAHRLWYHSTQGSRVINKQEKIRRTRCMRAPKSVQPSTRGARQAHHLTTSTQRAGPRHHKECGITPPNAVLDHATAPRAGGQSVGSGPPGAEGPWPVYLGIQPRLG